MVVHQKDNSTGIFHYDNHIYKRTDWPPHFHRDYELVHVLNGQLEAIIDGRKVILETGDFALCLSNEVHLYNRIGDTRYFVCVFSPDFVPQFHKTVEGKTSKYFPFRIAGSILSFFHEHIVMGYYDGIPEPHLQTAWVNLICGEYLKHVELMDRDNKEYALMNAIADYIGQNFRQKLTLRDVATALGYDYYYFSRLFYQIFSMKFNDYLNTCRFAEAVDALRSSDKPITQIAADSGFQSIRAFNDVFQRKTGMSPAQYRKQQKEF